MGKLKIKLNKDVISFLNNGCVQYENGVKSYLTMQGLFTETKKKDIYIVTNIEDL